MKLSGRREDIIIKLQQGWECFYKDTPQLSSQQPCITLGHAVEVVRRPLLIDLEEKGYICHPATIRRGPDWGAYVLTEKGKEYGSVKDAYNSLLWRGSRVELMPHTDLWARGARFGTITKIDLAIADGIVLVKMDHPSVKRVKRFKGTDLQLNGGKR